MAGSAQQSQNVNESRNTNTSSQQTNVENTNVSGNTSQQQNSSSSKNAWILNMPGLLAKAQNTVQEMNTAVIPQYQYANLNQQQQAALQTLMQGRSDDQMKQIMSQMQAQGAQFTNYGAQQDTINKLAQGYYQGDLVTSNKAALAGDINRQLSGQVSQLNTQAIGSGNMASSRAGIAQGVMTRGAQESYAKGAADIENNARNTAYQMATNQYATGQTNLSNNLAQQGTLGQVLANWDQTDANTAFNAGSQLQSSSQKQMDINRANELMRNTNNLQQLTTYLPALSSLAQFGQTSTGTQSGTSNSNSATNSNISASGTTSENSAASSNSSGNNNTSGDASGVNWGTLGSGLIGQAGASFVQPIASGAATGAVNWLSNIL